MVKEASGGPAVEKCVGLGRSKRSKASGRTSWGNSNVYTVKEWENLTVEEGSDSENAVRQLEVGLCLSPL
jgi:hypothetical protein